MAKKKSKDVTYQKLTKHFFHTGTKTWFSNQAFKYLKKTTGIAIVKGTACYSYVKRYGISQQIAIGQHFFSKSIDHKKETDIIPVKDLKSTYKRMSVIYKGVFFHEVAHHLYTDMNLFNQMMTEFSKKSATDIMAIFKQTMNTIEDVVIEDEFDFYRPLIGKSLKYLRSSLFSEKKVKEIEDMIDDDDVDEISAIFNYLLVRYRVPSRVKFEHPLYTKHKKDIHSGMYVCLKTSDPTKRLKRTLAYSYELYRLLIKGEDFDLKEVIKGKGLKWIQDLPDMSKIKPKLSPPAGSPLDADGKESPHGTPATGKPTKSTAPSSIDEDGSPVSEEAEDLTGGKEVESGKTSSPIAGEGEDDEDLADVDPSMRKNQDTVIRNAANDEPMINFDHLAMYCNDYFDNSDYESQYQDVVSEYEDEIKRVVAIIKKILATNNNKYARHKTKGKLDKRKISKRITNNRLFKKQIDPKPVADLAMSFLVDNSGSMGWGRKTRIVGRALIILQETCNRLGIPYEVNAFTEASNTAITIEMKRFEDRHKDCKNNAVIISHEIRVSPLHTFEGNVDESNLDFVAKRFLANRKEKDKVLIYMADGATCGDNDSLKHVGDSIVKSGISVLAIGIVDPNVKRSFPDNHIIFDTIEDLEKLAPTLQTYVLRKMFKGE